MQAREKLLSVDAETQICFRSSDEGYRPAAETPDGKKRPLLIIGGVIASRQGYF
jgi:hypothetical protein